MDIIQSKIDVNSIEFKENREFANSLLETLRERNNLVKLGGGETSVAKHRKRNKFLARERIEKIIDDGSPFLELSSLAGFEVYDMHIPSAGVVTGIGRVHGVECMFVANDATVKGGTYFPLTVKKHIRAQEIAIKNNLPCIYLVDSGGAFSTDAR